MMLKLGRFWKVSQKYRGTFQVCWRRMIETISGTYHVKNEEVLHGVKDRYMLHTVDWVCILRLCSAHFVYICFV
jgi:hypothetical protein